MTDNTLEDLARMIEPQPLPVPNDARDVQSQVIDDIDRRREHGIATYGTALQPFNGRDALRDAYEEALDLTMYLKQAMLERDGQASQQQTPYLGLIVHYVRAATPIVGNTKYKTTECVAVVTEVDVMYDKVQLTLFEGGSLVLRRRVAYAPGDAYEWGTWHFTHEPH